MYQIWCGHSPLRRHSMPLDIIRCCVIQVQLIIFRCTVLFRSHRVKLCLGALESTPHYGLSMARFEASTGTPKLRSHPLFDGHRAFGVFIGYVVTDEVPRWCFGNKPKVRISTPKDESDEKEMVRQNTWKSTFHYLRLRFIDFVKVCATSRTHVSWCIQFQLLLIILSLFIMSAGC